MYWLIAVYPWDRFYYPPFADEDPEAHGLGNLPTVTVESVVKDKLWGPVLSGKGE